MNDKALTGDIKAIHTVIITQKPNGKTFIEARIERQGDGPISPEMMKALVDYNNRFAGFMGDLD